MIVWETKRSTVEIPDFCNNSLNNEFDQTEFVSALKAFLSAMEPFDRKESKRWEWLETTASLEQVQDVEQQLQNHLP